MRPRTTRTFLMAAGLAAAATCAACTAGSAAGGSGSSSGGSPSASSAGVSASSAASTTATAPVAAAGDAAALSFVGMSKGGTAAGTPVRIGYVNQDAGVPSFPEATVAAKAAVAYINSKLDGVQGHPLQLVTCPVTSEAQAQSCAQKFLNDSTIKVIQTGALTVGNASLYNTIAGRKPILGGNPTAPADFTAKNTYFYTPGGPGVNSAIATYIAATLKAKTVSVVHSDDPGGSTASQIGVAVLKAAGVKAKDVSFAASGGDLSAPLVASGAQTSNAIEFAAAGPACLQMAQAQKQLSLTATIVSTSLCLDPSVKKQLGDYPIWTYGTSYPNVYVDGSDAQVNLYRRALTAAAGPDANVGGFAPVVFGSLIDLDKTLNSIGYAKLSPATIGTALKAYHGAAFLGAPDISCGVAPATPTVCTQQARILQYKGNGEWSDPTGGKWIAGKS